MTDQAPIKFPWEAPPAAGEAVEVASGILWGRLPLPMALDHVNIFALDDGDGWTLIDAGMNWAKGRAALEAFLAGPLAGKPVKRVLVTHHHPDHVGCAASLVAMGAELLMPRVPWLLARMLTIDEQEVWPAESLAFYRAAGMRADLLEARATERPFNFADCVAPLPLGFTGLQEGQEIRLGGRDWTVRLGGGHAPDHATLWSDDIVIGGDQLLPSISPNIGVYPTEPEANPLADWFAACDRMAPHARDGQLVLPGHKLPFTGLPARLEQLRGNHVQALNRLRNELAEPKTAGSCFVPIFKREIKDSEYGLALVEALAHCLYLWHAGEATREIKDGAWLFQMR